MKETTYSDVHKGDLPLLPVTPQVELMGFISVRHLGPVWASRGLGRNVARHLDWRWRSTFFARHLDYIQRWRAMTEAAKVTAFT